MTLTRTRKILFGTTGLVLLIAVVVALLFASAPRSGQAAAPPSATSAIRPSASPRPTATTVPYTALSTAAIAALPSAQYNAVIAGLIPYYDSDIPTAAATSYSLGQDAALYGEDQKTPVAKLAAKNFLNDPTVVVPVRFEGPWALVLTPARQQLPSAAPGGAAAQTVGWIRRDLLTKSEQLPDHIVVSVKAQTVAIVDQKGHAVQTFRAGVGAVNTPTPTGVVGYIQGRYLDPAQGQSVYPINLTSLHSSAADEPYGGDDGGLIGVHYEAENTGQISHGCVRLDATAVTAINKLPLGTLVQLNP